ncbi:uncharacterized protein LOC120011420 isoform X2 [Tripterygium wilfordii]|uniref:uncharacterized protein LOC120011420 isoform X2 n=1 Tax=Tripterygium wilfordii TaxID=458696 RepID=UPI0018F80158|nr:uncharacterized protein LOC120011420 isoform X2 [Tripterygium wilfordii]
MKPVVVKPPQNRNPIKYQWTHLLSLFQFNYRCDLEFQIAVEEYENMECDESIASLHSHNPIARIRQSFQVPPHSVQSSLGFVASVKPLFPWLGLPLISYFKISWFMGDTWLHYLFTNLPLLNQLHQVPIMLSLVNRCIKEIGGGVVGGPCYGEEQ